MQKSFVDKLASIKNTFLSDLGTVTNLSDIEAIKRKYIAKNGVLQIATASFKKLIIEEKKAVGSLLVDLKKFINTSIMDKKNLFFFKECGFPDSSTFDPSLSKKNDLVGGLHPYTITFDLIDRFFSSLGFDVIEGPVLTNEYDNFTSLNVSYGHPAREESDTFWIEKDSTLLRTHTSNIQVSEAKKRKPPFGLVSVGSVYRNESTDMTHDFMFFQVEGLFFGESASISSLLFTLKSFLNVFFEKDDLNVRARPGIFPFVEPGIEIDFECPFCHKGCSVCKYTKWIEVGGAGIVHPFVKKEMGIDQNNIGWAFGMGITRLVSLKYNISDIRELHQSVFSL